MTQSANAEGIASEGGSANAANPRGVLTDAPSAEADRDSLRMEVQAARAKALRDNEYLLARAEAAEQERDQAWDDAEVYSQDAHHWQDVYRNVVARAEAAETALREAEEALTHDGPEGPGQRMFDALAILKRTRSR